MATSEQIPTFPELFKPKAKGKISRWQVSVQPVNSEHYQIQTVFGELDGAQQTHITNITKGKAKRTPLEQATLEAQSKWNEKRSREAYVESLDAAASSDQKPMVRPMLANTFDKELYRTTTRAYTIPFPMYAQRKYDGIRCICSLDTTTSSSPTVVLESRKGVVFQTFELLKAEIMRILYANARSNTNIYFDGELYTDKINFETISGLVRLTKAKATEEALRQIDQIEYHVYDVFDPSRPNLTFDERRQILQGFSSASRSLIQIVPTEEARTLDEIKQLHDKYVAEGFEGIMLRDKKGVYECNKRSKYLQKYKEFMEEEFPIVGFHDGEGIDQGLVIWECETKEGTVFSAKPRGTHEYRRELYEHAHECIGKILTVIFQEYSADGTPRFPVGKAIRDGT
jgi:ATP-dependent DNA ligase